MTRLEQPVTGPQTNQECVVAVYPDLERARNAIHILERSSVAIRGYVVTNEVPNRRELIQDLKMGDDSVIDGVAGGAAGALIGALAGTAFGVVIGPFAGGMLGAVVGSFIGSMSGWGVHKHHYAHYEKLLQDGKVLLLVHGSPQALAEADRMLKETGPEEIHLDAKTGSESPEVNPTEPLKPR